MQLLNKRNLASAMLLGLIVPLLAACGGAPAAQAPIRETVVVEVTSAPQVVKETVVVEQTVVSEAPTGEAPAATEAFTIPHPIIGDVKVRQAIAHCANRPELIASVYPFLNAEQQTGLLMDTFLPKAHWAAATDVTTYPFDVEKGKALLEEAGWVDDGSGVRAKDGMPLSLSFTTTNAQFRQTWSAVLINQLTECGVQLIPTYAPGSWWFGDSTGLARRDFELGAFAWVGQADPGGISLYACNQIPLPSNGWEGQNSMGWCNETASNAIVAANNTLDRDERIKQYGIAQQEFAKDMVSLPLFNRTEAAAANTNLVNFKPNPTEYITANASEWELSDGGDTLVIGLTQEPASMFTLVESAAVQRVSSLLISAQYNTTYDYDYQPEMLKELATIENGAATNETITVKAGDKVWNTAGEVVDLAAGVELINDAGETVTYESGDVAMKQLKVTYEFVEGVKWQDGEALKQADFELAYKIDCDPDSGATTFTLCDSISTVDFASDTSYVVTYQPGVQWPTYFLPPVGAYPSHQVLSDGRKLADVAAKDWATLPEIAETPLSNGPYILESWEKGQKMTFTANPNYFKGEVKIKTIIIQFVADTQQAVAQLLTGEIDVLGSETLGAGAEVQTVLDAAAKGDVQATTIASPTWEHIDFNLFLK